MALANRSSDTDPPGVATSPSLTALDTRETDTPVGIPHLQGKPSWMPGSMGTGGDAHAAPPVLCRHLPNFSSPGQRKNHATLFSLLRKGSESPKGVRLRKDLNFIFPWGSSAPSSPSPPPLQALTNGADELLKSFLGALFRGSRSQRPPVATCQSRGLITCAGRGAAHSCRPRPPGC